MLTYDNFQFTLGYEMLNSNKQNTQDKLSDEKMKSKKEHLGTEYDDNIQEEVNEESEYLNYLFHSTEHKPQD
jgi:hypothetical protein